MRHIVALGAGIAAVVTAGWAGAADPKTPFTREFPTETCEFVTTGKNPYFSLTPGTKKYYTNRQCVADGECTDFEELRVSILNRTRTISIPDDGEIRRITTRVLEERHYANDALVEYSRNYFAECKGTQDVYYFGEDVDIIENGQVVSHDGAWLAGQDGAEPGIVMPGGAFLLGARYFQEIAPGLAMDRAENVNDDLDIEVPAGAFEDCVQVRETTPLEPGAVSIKFYCPGVGLTIDGDLGLEALSE